VDDTEDEALRKPFIVEMSGALYESIFVVDSSATGGEIRLRSKAFPDALTLPVRIGGGVEVFSRLPARMVNALASDIVTGAFGSRW
jgi:hypothetical protein